jgi:Tol biopolymer transport system component
VGRPFDKQLIRLTNLFNEKLGPDPVAPPPIWSPDGALIAFNVGTPFTTSAAGAGIGIVDKLGNNLTIVSHLNAPLIQSNSKPDGIASGAEPSWFSDSTSLVFVASATQCNCPSLFWTDKTGTKLKVLKEHVLDAQVAPFGDLIATSYTTDSSVVLSFLRPDGAVHLNAVKWPRHNSQGRLVTISDLDWSPDGMSIAFTSNIQGDLDIYTISVDGSDLVDVTGWSGNEASPKWRPRQRASHSP